MVERKSAFTKRSDLSVYLKRGVKMSVSWGFSVGNVRAREVSLLKKRDLSEMAGCSSEQQLITALSDKGFGGADAKSTEQAVNFETDALWEYVRTTAADFTVFNPFLLDNDYHNLKAVIKGVLSGKEYKNMLLFPTVTDIEVIETAVKEKKFSLLPPYMADDAADGYSLLAATSDVQLVDGILDKSRMKATLSMCQKAPEVMSQYIKTKVFFENVKVALRGSKMGKNADFFKKTLYLEQGLDSLISAACEGTEAVLEWLKIRDEGAAESFKLSPSEFEKTADNRLMSVAKRAKFITSGPDVIIGFVLAKLAEIRAVSMIATGIRTETDEDKIRERLRELYD